jgi:hypothetical protein
VSTNRPTSGPGSAPAPLKPFPLNDEAYVVRQLASGAWCVVDRSGPSRLTPPLPKGAPSGAKGDPCSRPGVDGRDPMEAMEASAKDRQTFAEKLDPDGHVLFLAVARSELAALGIR